MPGFRNSTTGTIAANGTSVTLAWREFFNGGVGVQVSGTFSGTLQFELTIDGTFVAVPALNVTSGTEATTTTGTGVFRFDVVGISQVRVTSTAWTSGTATLTIVALPG
jgi:cytoskeletal protein CcmA (bactofilin family)